MSEDKNKNDSDFSLNNSLNESEEFEGVFENKGSSNDLKKESDENFNKLFEIIKTYNEKIMNNINNMNQNLANISNELHNTCINLNQLVKTLSNNNLNNPNNPFLS